MFSPTSIRIIHSAKIIVLPLFGRVPSYIPAKCCFGCCFRSFSDQSVSKGRIPSQDFSVNSFVARSNWVITKLSREGKIKEARKVFDEMPEKDVMAWTAIISGYIKCGLLAEARKLFERVDAKKNVVTWTAMVGGYATMNRITEAERLFRDMPEKNVVSWNTMIEGYLRNGKISKALEVFDKMPERNVVSWNTMINALSRRGRIEEARELFERMPKKDVISWTSIISGLARNGRIDEAREVFDKTPEKNVVSWNVMVTGYAQNNRLDEAFELFGRMPERDLPSWNTMITGFINNGMLKKAKELFDEMPVRNVVSWTTMITGYVRDGQSEEALKVFSKMSEEGVKPNEGTFVSVLSACSDLAGLGEGHQIHQRICKTNYQFSELVVSALINMYSKCGELNSARRIFDDGSVTQRDVVSWNGIIAAYGHHGHGEEAINLFNQMKDFGFKPNDVTYVGLLSACSHSGRIEEGLEFFDELVNDKSIQVREDHYACYVDLCGRAGRLNEALDFIEKLDTKPSISSWTALLAGCHVHGNLELGKLAATRVLELEPENAGAYLQLSNIYASCGKWKDATEVRSKMKGEGLKKQPGCSWIEVENKVHVFVVGSMSHTHSSHIFSLLRDLHAKMKKVADRTNNDDNWFDDDIVIA